jgi:signal recognition particle GTPase
MKFLEHLAQQFAGKPIDWDELEESLIRADLGVPMTMRIIKTLQEREGVVFAWNWRRDQSRARRDRSDFAA